MSFPKVLALIALILFVTIGTAAWIKKGRKSSKGETSTLVEVPLISSTASHSMAPSADSLLLATQVKEKILPHGNRIEEFFNLGEPKFPIVETITYRSRVAWQKGRPAWLSDYANHYRTSRHFIARSLNGKADYFKQEIAEGDRFNILAPNKNIQFYLLIDTSLCRLWLYYLDLETNERVFIKDYVVGLGRKDPSSESGLLTPLGKYSLGNRIAVYKPKMMGFHHGQKVEMIQIFGSRWIPFEQEISDATAPARGFGIHGVPWKPNAKGELIEDRKSLGEYAGDGCIRLSAEDIEEIFAIIITKPAIIELVKNFHDAKLEGIEK
jgi:L,D-transpeptidase catalytic domain